MATNATHANGLVELDTHNMWGMMEERATHLALQTLLIQPGHWECKHELDAALEGDPSVDERLRFLLVGPFNSRGIWHTPVSRDRLARLGLVLVNEVTSLYRRPPIARPSGSRCVPIRKITAVTGASFAITEQFRMHQYIENGNTLPA